MANSKRKGARRKSRTKPSSGRAVKAAAKRPVKKAGKAANRRKAASAPASKSSLKRKTVARPAAPKMGVAAARSDGNSASNSARKKASAGKRMRRPKPQPTFSETTPVAVEAMAQTALDLDTTASDITDRSAHEAPTLEMEPVETDWAEFSQPVAVTPDGLLGLPPESDSSPEQDATDPATLH
jgi:hypothetical protein